MKNLRHQSLICLTVFWFCFFVISAKPAMSAENGGVVMPIDTEASPPLSHQLSARFSWGAKINADFRLRDNRDLQNNRDDLDARSTGELSLAAQYLPKTSAQLSPLSVFAELGLDRVIRQKEGEGKTSDEARLRVKKAYLRWSDFFHPALSLQVGRQRFKDKREWIYDDALDAIRIFYNQPNFELQFSYSSNFFDPLDVSDRIKNIILFGIYDTWKQDKAAFYVINRHGRFRENMPDFNLNFVGFSWTGKSIKRQRYWLESAWVIGDEANKDVLAHGFDVGWISRLKHPYKPALTIAYAFGSGDSNPNNASDTNFRQTGLQDNDAKLRGVTRVKQYGELFEPELSNLAIITVGVGFRPRKKASIDFIYHRYRQLWVHEKGNNSLRDDGIKKDPNGRSRKLGEEVDLIFGWRMSKQFKIEGVMAFFFPGTAFSDRSTALLGKIKIGYML